MGNLGSVIFPTHQVQQAVDGRRRGRNRLRNEGRPPAGDFLTPHLQDFLDCVRTRQQPACDLKAGRVSSALCHLGNIAYRLGRSIDFDPVKESFGADRAAAGFAHREPHGLWSV